VGDIGNRCGNQYINKDGDYNHAPAKMHYFKRLKRLKKQITKGIESIEINETKKLA